MVKHISESGLERIAAHEGLRLTAYKCPAGVWTIGYGHTALAGPPKVTGGMTITEQEALEILRKDLAKFERRVVKQGCFADQDAFDAAVSFDFNTGGIHRASWVRHYRKGDMTRAEKSFKLWVKAGGKTLPGLVKRRDDEAALIFKGADSRRARA